MSKNNDKKIPDHNDTNKNLEKRIRDNMNNKNRLSLQDKPKGWQYNNCKGCNGQRPTCDKVYKGKCEKQPYHIKKTKSLLI